MLRKRNSWRHMALFATEGGGLELRQLRYFATLAEELHFGRAASREHIVQSALSQQVQWLERELKVCLLERSTQGVRLTAAGAAFWSRPGRSSHMWTGRRRPPSGRPVHLPRCGSGSSTPATTRRRRFCMRSRPGTRTWRSQRSRAGGRPRRTLPLQHRALQIGPFCVVELIDIAASSRRVRRILVRCSIEAGHTLRCLRWWSLGRLGDWPLQPRSSPWRALAGREACRGRPARPTAVRTTAVGWTP
jgi:hypothetical protein